MKFIMVVFGLFCYVGNAQITEEQLIKKTIETFFEGFHAQDSVKIKSTVSNNVTLQTIAKDSLGSHFVKHEDFSNFLKSIVAIPASTQFKEIIKSYSIQIDGPMANAWTAYDFHLNGKFHHCGVNSFQLFKLKDEWKIIYLIDTRRKTCAKE